MEESTLCISSASASALKDEELNFCLNSSNCDNNSGDEVVFCFTLNREVKAPFSPNNLWLLYAFVNVVHFPLSSSIVFPNIANSLFFVVNILLYLISVVESLFLSICGEYSCFMLCGVACVFFLCYNKEKDGGKCYVESNVL